MLAYHRNKGRSGILWAYGYQLAPPVPRDRLVAMQAILDQGHMEARERAEVWEGRFINGDRITHILVVSGSPAQDTEINRRLEAELVRLEAGFSVSQSLEVVRGARPRSIEDSEMTPLPRNGAPESTSSPSSGCHPRFPLKDDGS